MRLKAILLLLALAIALAAAGWLVFAGRSAGREPTSNSLFTPKAPEHANPARSEATTELAASDRVEPDRVPISAQSSGAEPAAGVLRAVRVRGLVVDDATSEPVPSYLLRFDGGAGTVEATSDDRGRFEVELPGGVDGVTIVDVDDPRTETTIRRAGAPARTTFLIPQAGAAGSELVHRVRVGPTYRLRLEPSECGDPAGFSARLAYESGNGKFGGTESRLRPGDPPWVRFSTPAREVDRATSIHVWSHDGLWQGHAPAFVAKGVSPGTTVVSLRAFATLVVSVKDADGEPIRGAEMRLRNPADPPEWGEGMLQTTEANGIGTYPAQAAGERVLVVGRIGHAARTMRTSLQAGQVTNLEVVLTKLPIVGAIESEIVSDSGTYTPSVSLQLRPVGILQGVREGRVDWVDVAGVKHGRFRFADLPAGRYSLSIEKDDLYVWSSLDMEVEAPSTDVVVRAHDVPSAGLAFRFTDMATGAALPRARAWIRLEREPAITKVVDTRYGEVSLDGVPLAETLSWRLDCAEHQPAFGDQTSFRLDEVRQGSRVRTAEVGLVRGWGERYLAIDASTGKPLPGVRVLADGRLVGTTDTLGLATVLLSTAPDKIDAELDGWMPEFDSSSQQLGRREGLLTHIRFRRTK